jgi:hypothetical protein
MKLSVSWEVTSQSATQELRKIVCRFCTVFTKVVCGLLSWDGWVQSIPPPLISLKSVLILSSTASVVYCSEFLATNIGVPGSITGIARFFWVAEGLERGPLSLANNLRSYLEEIVAAPDRENRSYDRRESLRWPRDTLYPLKLALASLTGGDRSIDRYSSLRFFFLYYPPIYD